MAAAAPAVAAAAASAQAAEKAAAGIVHGISEALKAPIVHVRWVRDPKHYKRMIVESVELNVTVGLIGLGIGGALLWEAGSWFAKAFAGWNGGNPANIGLSALELLDPIAYIQIELPKWILQAVGVKVDANTPPQKVKVPASFGAALNTMLRDLTVAGPGTAAQVLTTIVGRLTGTA